MISKTQWDAMTPAQQWDLAQLLDSTVDACEDLSETIRQEQAIRTEGVQGLVAIPDWEALKSVAHEAGAKLGEAFKETLSKENPE